jgi:hypothetical protein
MKHTLYILFFLCCSQVFGQSTPQNDPFSGVEYYSETFIGDALDYTYAYKLIRLINENKPDSLRMYFAPSLKPDTALLNKECKYASQYFSSPDFIYNNCDCNFRPGKHLFARKYMKDTTITISLFAIMFQFKHTGLKVEVDTIDFLCGDNWVKSEKDLADPPVQIISNAMKHYMSIRDSIPPPPPIEYIKPKTGQ